MADAALKQPILAGLRQTVFSGDGEAVDVSDGEVEPNVHVVVFSRKFDGLDFAEKQDLIWKALEACLSDDDITHVTLLVGVSPAEAKAIM